MTIDLNCDLAEGMPNDALIMPFISSANIACGYHAGDAQLMEKTVELCLIHKVAIGAHPGFNDKPNFGRIDKHLSENELYDLMSDQLHVLQKICYQQGTQLHHVKPHGALYNMAARNRHISHVLVQAVKDFNPGLIFYGLSGSYMIDEAKSLSLATASEVFADRTYQEDGSLTPRSNPNALIESSEQAIHQVMQMVKQKRVTAITKTEIGIEAETICIHGDGAHAVEFSKYMNRMLREAGIIIKAI
jgi:5-oxoprolinase (ATP-hydrolysing) subunit A